MYSDKRIDRLLSAGMAVLACIIAATSSWAQKPVPSPPTSVDVEKDYTITSTIEFGARGLSVNGDREKFRSDLNYKSGIRIFDSSFLIENHTKGSRLFDNALITTSGWGADPTGSFTLKMNRTGAYRFDSNVRSVTYFNNLRTHAFNWSAPGLGSEHTANTKHRFGDFDVTVFPESEKFRMRLGYSFNDTKGPGSGTIRFPQFAGQTTSTRGDEFQLNSSIKSRSDDLRFGVEGELLGFNVGLNFGHRIFSDNSRIFLDVFSPGNNPDPLTASITSYSRTYPTRGTTDFANFYVQRTFEKKLDFTARIIYSQAKSRFTQLDNGVGSSSAAGPSFPRILIDLDQIAVTGDTKRPQTRADVGFTYRATDRFRISDTFNFDQFHISGGNRFFESLISRTTAGVPRPNDFSDNSSWRDQSYRRLTNKIEADFQVNNHFAFNAGYRFSRRRVVHVSLDRNVVTGDLNLDEDEKFTNTTNTLTLGTKIKPTKYWTIFADVEKGQSDNVFTRLANYDFTNFRVRSRWSLNKFSVNIGLITKNNDSPGVSEPILGTGGVILFPATETVATTKSRIFTGSIDWSPRPEINISAGYTYNRIDSNTDVLLPVGTPVLTTTTWFLAKSRYFTRDKYFYFDVSAKPIKRVSLYASYRINTDPGQGSLVATNAQDIFSSYPMRFQTPEARIAVRLTRNIDWNVGYQFYDYRETGLVNPFAYIVITGVPNTTLRLPAQNYTAHMPYMSLKFYFGDKAGDR